MGRQSGPDIRFVLSVSGVFGENKGEIPVMTKKTSVAETATPRRSSPDPLGTNTEIGRKLKQYYDDLVSDEIPDRFASLLAQLEDAKPQPKKD